MKDLQNPLMQCRRCGACCRSGGPALHEEDWDLVEEGSLPLTDLYTLRKGEMVRDNVAGGLMRLTAEIIKIKSVPDGRACLYFMEARRACRIYGHRPVECRTLECWNTAGIEQLYQTRRLTREAIVKDIPWLWELVMAHEAECGLEAVGEWVERRASGDKDAWRKLVEGVRFDHYFRQVAVEKGGLPQDMLMFLLGRPLAEILSDQFGVKVWGVIREEGREGLFDNTGSSPLITRRSGGFRQQC